MADDYAICLLAGGLARRMGGGDKGEIRYQGKTILAHLCERFSDAPYLFLNANGDAGRFAQYDLPVVSDILPDHQGPLAGIHAALTHIQARNQKEATQIEWLITLPTDAPLLPDHLVKDLRDHRSGHKVVSVQSHGRTHPVIGLWSVAILPDLEQALCDEGIRKIDLFTKRYDVAYLPYDTRPDPFLNLNRPEDVEALMESGL
ncbi:MAG: molybdenum cofactor guanylyltransferase MobA [Candidatus Puniceispirillaceae bacterium]